MAEQINLARRKAVFSIAAVAASIPLAANAAKNDNLRKAMKYEDSTQTDKKCSACMHWTPGKDPADRGGCKIFPGDTEIHPNGTCSAWAKKTG